MAGEANVNINELIVGIAPLNHSEQMRIGSSGETGLPKENSSKMWPGAFSRFRNLFFSRSLLAPSHVPGASKKALTRHREFFYQSLIDRRKKTVIASRYTREERKFLELISL